MLSTDQQLALLLPYVLGILAIFYIVYCNLSYICVYYIVKCGGSLVLCFCKSV